jgi:hypothetical protein
MTRHERPGTDGSGWLDRALRIGDDGVGGERKPAQRIRKLPFWYTLKCPAN